MPTSPATDRLHARPGVARASLIEIVPELGEGLPADELETARAAALVATVRVPGGPWAPAELLAAVEEPMGLLVCEGLLARDTLLAGSVASDLLGPGDVAAVGPARETLVPAELRWTASVTSRVAVLDGGLLSALEAHPGLAGRLLARATRQTSELSLQRAFSQLPRVDQRLLALFWHLAERWGRVATDGILVRLALTHEALGRMVGARRPTVSLALKDLAGSGTVVRRPDGAWLLRQDGLERLRPVGSAAWQAPETSLLPWAPTARPADPPPVPGVDGAVLREQLCELSLDHAEHERRVREVLARCAATREQLTAARRRRAAQSGPRPRVPAPR